MRNPLALLATSLVLAGAAAAADAPGAQTGGALFSAPTSPGESRPLETWNIEESFTSWRPVDFTDDFGTRHTLWCRDKDCPAERRSGRAKLYVLTPKGAPQKYRYRDIPRGVFGVDSTKTTYSTLLSKFELAMDSKPHKAVLRNGGQAFPVRDPQMLTSLGAKVIVQAPSGEADDAPKKAKKQAAAGKSAAGKKRTGKKEAAPAHAPAQGKAESAVAAVNVPLTETEEKWLTFGEHDNYAKALAEAKTDDKKVEAYTAARKLIVENILDKETEKGGYAKKVAISSAAIEAYLKPLGFYSGDDVKLTDAELAALSKEQRETYKARMDGEATDGGKLDHVRAHQIVKEYRLLAVKNKPELAKDSKDGKQSAAAAAGTEPEKEKPLTPEEKSKLLEEYLKTKLTGADKENFEKAMKEAKTADERDLILDAYLAKAAPGITEDELAGLKKPLQQSLCGQLNHRIKTGVPSEFKVRLTTEVLTAIDNGKTTFDTAGIADEGQPWVHPDPPTLGTRSPELKKLQTKCLNLDLNDSKDSGKKAMKGSVPDVDKTGEPEEKGPNEWLNVKRGVGGAVMGLVALSAFGPVGMIVGALVGFGIGWGLSKLEE